MAEHVPVGSDKHQFGAQALKLNGSFVFGSKPDISLESGALQHTEK
jgi:hypothetical protein